MTQKETWICTQCEHEVYLTLEYSPQSNKAVLICRKCNTLQLFKKQI